MSLKFQASAVYILFCLIFSSGTISAAEKAGTIKLVKGEVFILDAKTKSILADPTGKKGRSTQKNSEFFEGEIIQTKADARVKLEFIEGKNSVVLGPSTSLAVERAGNNKDKKGTDLELKNGSVRSVVKQKYSAEGDDVFQVKTPNAVAGVRGTIFSVSFDIKTATTNVLTESGLVSLMTRAVGPAAGQNRFQQSSGEVLISAGTKSEVDSSAKTPTPAKKATPKEMQNMKKMENVEGEDKPSDLSPANASKKKDLKPGTKEDTVAVSLAPKPSNSMKEENNAGGDSSTTRTPASSNPNANTKVAPPATENIMVAGGMENMAAGSDFGGTQSRDMPFDMVDKIRKQQIEGTLGEATNQRLTDGVTSEARVKIQ